jgi:hypothetical protein
MLQAHFTVVADTFYAKAGLIRYCLRQGIIFISRLRIDAVLYDGVKHRRRRRGRPRKYGQRLPSLRRLAKRWSSFKNHTLFLYGKEVTVSVSTFTAYWRPAGTMIRIFMVKYPKRKDITCFFCTDITRSVADVLTIVSGRWSLENAFRDMKQYLGLSDYQCRKEQAVERFVNLVGAALSLLTLWSHQEYSTRQPELWDATPWYTRKKSASVKDMIQQLRNKCIHKLIFDGLYRFPINRNKLDSLLYALKMAA